MTEPTEQEVADELESWLDAGDTLSATECVFEHGRAIVAALHRLAAERKDAERLDWIEENHTLHKEVQITYVVAGYEVELVHENGVTTLGGPWSGDDLRAAIDAAIAESK